MSTPCKISDWGCVYHACMSDDCQKEIVKSQNYNWGPGKCEERVTMGEHTGILIKVEESKISRKYDLAFVKKDNGAVVVGLASEINL